MSRWGTPKPPCPACHNAGFWFDKKTDKRTYCACAIGKRLLMKCPRCDGEGSYKVMDDVVRCDLCAGGGDIAPLTVKSIEPEDTTKITSGTTSFGGVKYVFDPVKVLPPKTVEFPVEEFTATAKYGPPFDPITLENQTVTISFEDSGGSPEYLKLLDQMRELHLKKAADYGSEGDPMNNLRAAEQIGIPAWKGAWLRALDKVKRINQFCLKEKLENESVEDSFMDLAAYSMLALVLYRELKAKEGE